MKYAAQTGIGFILFFILTALALASESSSYRLEQVIDDPNPHQAPSSEIVQKSEGTVVSEAPIQRSDYLTQEQLKAWNEVGVVGKAFTILDGKTSVSYGVAVEPTVLVLNNDNAYQATARVEVIEGERYPYSLFSQVLAEPRSQKNERILPTHCRSDNPCMDAYAADWAEDELGIGFALRGPTGMRDLNDTNAYRSFVQNTIAFPIARSTSFSGHDATSTLIVRARLVKEQREQSYWGHIRLLLMPHF